MRKYDKRKNSWGWHDYLITRRELCVELVKKLCKSGCDYVGGDNKNIFDDKIQLFDLEDKNISPQVKKELRLMIGDGGASDAPYVFAKRTKAYSSQNGPAVNERRFGKVMRLEEAIGRDSNDRVRTYEYIPTSEFYFVPFKLVGGHKVVWNLKDQNKECLYMFKGVVDKIQELIPRMYGIYGRGAAKEVFEGIIDYGFKHHGYYHGRDTHEEVGINACSAGVEGYPPVQDNHRDEELPF